jgi:hypothetical protein
MARYISANDIINQVCIEVGLNSNTDPVASQEDTYIQMTGLLTAAGQELVEMVPWQVLRSVYELVTADGDTGTYDLPDDFAYMVDQTGWDLSNNVPVAGPLSAQQWCYLEGRDLVSSTIYASFRLFDNTFNLFPQPPPVGMTVKFEYINRNWVLEAGDGALRRDTIGAGTNIVLYEAILIKKFLKVKWLDAKGFDSTAARLDFDTIFSGRVGRDKGAPVLSAAGSTLGFPYLNAWYNAPYSGYGQ